MEIVNRRRRYWINSKFQMKYLRMILLLELVVMAVTAVVTLSLAFFLFNPAFESGVGWNKIFIGFVGFALAVGGAFVYLGVRLSHRICGPVYRMQRVLQAIRNGEDPGPVTLRDGDELQELAEDLGMTIDSLMAIPRPIAVGEE